MRQCLVLFLILKTLNCVISIPEFGFRFIDSPKWQVVIPDQEIHLTCTTNLKADKIIWYLNHAPIFPDAYIKIKTRSKRKTNLILKVPQTHARTYEGLYQCVASVGSISVVSLPGRIKVAYIEPFQETTTVSQVEVEEGDSFTVRCKRPSSSPEASLRFYQDGTILSLSNATDYFLTEFGDLIVQNSKMEMSGIYTCHAYNPLLKKTYQYSSSTVVEVMPRLGDVSLVEYNMLYKNTSLVLKGSPIKLLCLTIGQVNPIVNWTVESKGANITLNSTSPVVTVTPEQDSVYICSTTHGKDSTAYMAINVQYKPTLINATSSSSVSEGESIELFCEFKAYPEVTVAWVFNGQFLVTNNNIKVNGSRITVKNIQRNQAGIYQCFAFNPIGTASNTFMVSVIPDTVTEKLIENVTPSTLFINSQENTLTKDKSLKQKKKHRKKWKKKGFTPSRPWLHKLTDESALITWNMTDDNIVVFKVQFKEIPSQTGLNTLWKTVDENIPSDINSYEVTGLKVDHEYRFRVAAVYKNNNHKFSPSSKKFLLKRTIQLQRPSTPPTIVLLSQTEPSIVDIKWEYEATEDIEGFIIYYQESTSAAHFNKITLLGSKRRRFRVVSLKPETIYDFKMSSFNMAGRSPTSPISSLIHLGVTETPNQDPQNPVIPVTNSDYILSYKYLKYLIIIGLIIIGSALVVLAICYERQRKFRRHSQNSSITVTSKTSNGKDATCETSKYLLPSHHHTVSKESKIHIDWNKNSGKVKPKTLENPSEYDRFICRLDC